MIQNHCEVITWKIMITIRYKKQNGDTDHCNIYYLVSRDENLKLNGVLYQTEYIYPQALQFANWILAVIDVCLWPTTHISY